MQECLLSSNMTADDPQACVTCLATQTPEANSLDCTVNSDFVCGLTTVCASSCGSDCDSEIETFGFCTSAAFFSGCPQSCDVDTGDGTPENLRNTTCTSDHNKVLSCLFANAGSQAEADSETCGNCIAANPPPTITSSGDCAAANEYACAATSECYSQCGTVCNDELFTYLQCEGNNLAGREGNVQQCSYQCNDEGEYTTSASVTRLPVVSTRSSILLIGSFLVSFVL